ncbi:ABC transporter permease [Paenibacillus lignilyticus]|uniref:Transport permease protein n=1 Tax=Paenibacillus lignilyticus TaxID=1172615 RepID=A0ABS5C6V4_9BACL|nr:ABC transporter permease [Paenibacillus lignilyticus]MBP3961690.1 ABC transporter permease [Paenibacillus lignilyticus]MBP3963639.1 ABC transporter permease [Paenibacillus lignilyticus]
MKLMHVLSDTAVMSGRVIRYSTRSIDTIITVLAMPIMMMLLFVYVFGGAMDTGDLSYINYIVPGILLFCIASGVAYSSLRINNDLTKGVFERFHSMPIAKASILGGHVIASLVFNVISLIAIFLAAFLMGFRPQADALGWVLAILILLLSILAFTWIAVTFGLLAKTFEGAGVFAYILMLLLFVSSAFAPTDSMPRAVRVFAEYQPMTPLIESIRSLLLGGTADQTTLSALIWSSAILVVFCYSAMKVYKRRMK